jgi:hypothetical protein
MKKDDQGNAGKQLQDGGLFDPTVGIVFLAIFVIALIQNLPAFHAQTPVHQAAPKVGRYIGSIGHNRHGNIMDKAAYWQPMTQPSVPGVAGISAAIL